MNTWKYSCVTSTCPYYKKETQQVIYCEGLLPDTSIHLAFGNAKECAEYKGSTCRGNHNKCPIFKMMEEFYGL